MWNLILIASYQKFAFLLPERYFFNDLNFPVFENCYSFCFPIFLFYNNCMQSVSKKKSVIQLLFTADCSFSPMFWGPYGFPPCL